MNRPLPLAALLALLAALLLAPLPTAAQPKQPAGPAELGLSDIPYEPAPDEPTGEEPQIVEEPGPVEAPGEEPELAASLAAESEPNDTRAQADPIGIGRAAAQTGTLSTPSDVDFYAFTATAGRTYVIETFNIDGQIYGNATGLYLYNASGTEITNDRAGSNGSGGVNARMVFRPSNGGTYYIRVGIDYFSSGWSGAYALRVLPRYDQGLTWDTQNDYEPNDAFALANPISVGAGKAITRQLRDVSNLVTADTDQDYYRFTAAAGRTYVIETFNIDGQPYSNATGIYIYNASGTEIANDRAGSSGSGNVNARVVFTATSSGTYFIRVAQDYFSSGWTGTYSLRLLAKYNESGAAWFSNGEPNDVLALAYPLGVGVGRAQTRSLAPIDSFVTPDRDRDVYSFSAVAGRSYTIQTFNIQLPSDRNATGIYLYNSTGAEVANDRAGGNGSGNVNAQISFRPSNSGTFFILVRPDYFDDAWTGTYSVRVCDGGCTYRVYMPTLRLR